jgi:hypothetical protein
MKKIDLEFVKGVAKTAANLKFGMQNNGWSLDTTLSAVKHTGSAGLGFVAGIVVSYVW